MSRAKIDELLSERHLRFTPLQRLLRQATNQDTWTAEVRALLPANLAGDCQVTAVNGPVVTISCRNAASATKLRLMAPDLLSQLNGLATFAAAREIRVRVSA